MPTSILAQSLVIDHTFGTKDSKNKFCLSNVKSNLQYEALVTYKISKYLILSRF